MPLLGALWRFVHATQIYGTKSCAGLLKVLVKHFTSILQSAPSGLYFCQKTLGFFLCSARAKVGQRPVWTVLEERGHSACAVALQRHFVWPQNLPSVSALLRPRKRLPTGLCSWKALGEHLLRCWLAEKGIIWSNSQQDVTNSLHLNQGTMISLMRTLIIIMVLGSDKLTQVLFPVLPALLRLVCKAILYPYPSLHQDLAWIKGGGGEEGWCSEERWGVTLQGVIGGIKEIIIIMK